MLILINVYKIIVKKQIQQSNDDDHKNSTNSYNNNNNEIIKDKNKDKLSNLNNIKILLDCLKTYKGSLISQEFICNISDEKECSILFNNIKPYICSIMCQEYGNYFFQKLLKKINLEEKLIIYQIIEPNCI